jgi:predicted porin
LGVLVRGDPSAAVDGGRGTHSSVASGMNGHNFIGFKMSEDLGNGMTLSGNAQFGFNLDSGDGAFTGTTNAAENVGGLGLSGSTFRTITSTLALSGDFGTVVAGRTGGARAAFIKKYDPFGGFGAARHQQGGEDYANNVVAWVTPEILPGLKGLAAYTSSLDQQDSPGAKLGAGNLYALALMYDQGPASAVVNYERLKISNPASGGGLESGSAQVITVGGSYDFGVVKAYALYDQLTNLLNGWNMGLAAPVSEQMTVKVGYSTQELRGEGRRSDATDCDKWGVGATYDVSKRTRFYTDYGRFSDGECQITTYGGLLGGIQGSETIAGYGKWGFNAGLRHSF